MKNGRLKGFMCTSKSSTTILRSTVASRRPNRTLADRGGVDLKYSRLVDARRQAAKREKMLQLVPLHSKTVPPEKRLQLVPFPTAPPAEKLQLVPLPTGAPERSLQLVHLPTVAPPEKSRQLVHRPTAAPEKRRLQLNRLSTAAPAERRLQLVHLPTAAPPDRRMKMVEKNSDGKVTPELDFQVVKMRVSVHCQGCAGKVRKHLAKMEGVKSVTIDLEEKRVTVEGRVSPEAVLQSVSRVKRAELLS